VIKPLSKSEFVNIATNGIIINLYEKYVEDYIENLMKFIEDVTHDYYISDYDTEWCELSKKGNVVITVEYSNGKAIFLLPKQDIETEEEKISTGTAIKAVYMHSIAWELLNNDGKVNQSVEPWTV